MSANINDNEINDIVNMIIADFDGGKNIDAIKLFNNPDKGEVKELRRLSDGEKPMPWTIQSLEPAGVRKISMHSDEKETLFHVRIQSGDFIFFEIK